MSMTTTNVARLTRTNEPPLLPWQRKVRELLDAAFAAEHTDQARCRRLLADAVRSGPALAG